MSLYTEILPATKSQPHRAYTWEPVTTDDSPLAGVLTLTDRRTHTRYLVSEFPADTGRGFVLRKPGGDGHYNCCVAGSASLCDCRGFAAHSHCKHTAALADLCAAGKL